MQTQRAYSRLEIKATGTAPNGRRSFSGIATTPSADRMGDVVDSRGAQFKLPLPLLWQHDAHDPVGWITKARVTSSGIEVDAEVADVAEPGPLKQRLETAWQMLTSGLVRGLSIGFAPREYEPIDAKDPWGPIKYKVWEWLELSAVTIPANQDAGIATIKSIDRSLLAASGRKGAPLNPPASGRNNVVNSPLPKGNKMQTPNEKLAALNEQRGTKLARMNELGEIKTTEARSLSDEERSEFKQLAAEIRDIDDDIELQSLHVANIKTAKPVDGGATRAPAGYVKKFTDVEEKFKGENGLKRALCNIQAQTEVKQGRFATPSQVAAKMYGKTNPTLVAIMKANEVPGAGTDSGEWGAELAAVDNRYTGDFIEYLYGMTVFDRLPLRSVPHNVAIKGQDGAFTGYFIGQSKAIKVSAGDFSSTSTVAYKAAGLCVVSNEWLRDASGDGLALCGQGLREAVAQAVDGLFFSTTAVQAGVAPAGILNGVSIGSSNGSDSESVTTDIKALFAPFISAKNLSGGLAWVMTPTTAVALSLMRNALGQAEYPTINGNGGTFMGYPVYVGDNVGTQDVILMKPSDIWKIGDLGVSLSTSDSAMIEQSTAPTGATDTPVAATQYMTSMFQEDSTAIKVVRPISWGKRRASAVAYIGNAAWGAEQS